MAASLTDCHLKLKKEYPRLQKFHERVRRFGTNPVWGEVVGTDGCS